MTCSLRAAAHLLGERALDDAGLARDQCDVLLRAVDGSGELLAGEAQELAQVAAALAVVAALLQLGRRLRCVLGGRDAQPLGERREAYPDRSHGIAEVVQHALGEFRKAGLVGLIDELGAGLRDPPDHAIEFARQHADLVAALEIEPRGQVAVLAQRHGVPRHERERPQDHAVEYQHQQHHHDHRGGHQAGGGVAHRRLAAHGDLARHAPVAAS